MGTTTKGIEGLNDLAALAADLSRADGDGHRWDEDDARRWLLRTGSAGSVGEADGAAEDSRFPDLLRQAS